MPYRWRTPTNVVYFRALFDTFAQTSRADPTPGSTNLQNDVGHQTTENSWTTDVEDRRPTTDGLINNGHFDEQ